MRIYLSDGLVLIALILLLNSGYLVYRNLSNKPEMKSRTTQALMTMGARKDAITWTYDVPSSMGIGATIPIKLQLHNPTDSAAAADVVQIVATAPFNCSLVPETPVSQGFPKMGTSSLWVWKLSATGVGTCRPAWRAVVLRRRGGPPIVIANWNDAIDVTSLPTPDYVRRVALALVVGALLVVAAAVSAFVTRVSESRKRS